MNVGENLVLNDAVTEQFTLGSAASSAASNPVPPPNYTFANGTSTGGTITGVIDLWFEKANLSAVTLAPSASATYVMSALTDDQGRTVAYARLRKFLLQITAKTLTSNDFLTVAPGGTHGLTAIGTFTVYDLDLKIWNNPAGLPVASGSTDQITITNSGANPITFALRTTGNST